MGAIRLVFVVAVLAIVAGVALYFAPNDIKEKSLGYISDIPFLPEEVKKSVEDIYATPAYRREKALTELNKNLASLESIVEFGLPEPDEALETIERTKELVQEILDQNSDSTVVDKITTAVINKLTEGKNICPQPES